MTFQSTNNTAATDSSTDGSKGAAASSSAKPTLAHQIMAHPLYNGEGKLPTLPIHEMFTAVRRAILLGETGYVFTGHSGIGKTCAINMVKAMLGSQFPRLCMFTHDAHNHQIPSIRAFFKHFLTTVGHKELRGETYDLRSRLVNILIDEARISGINRVVMFIDEASAMLKTDFLFLKDVHNDLARGNVQLITVLMGQSPDMEGVIAKLRRDDRSDLVNRFATRLIPVRCYNKLEDIKLILKGVDTSRFPGPAGPSWTAFFLPKACKAGFLLENEAEPFLQAIRDAGTGTSGAVMFPARQTFLAIRDFLLSAAAADSEQLPLPADRWARAVEYAKLEDAIHQMKSKTRARKKSKEGSQ